MGSEVCDVTEFLMLHPGGNDVLLQYGGQEARLFGAVAYDHTLLSCIDLFALKDAAGL